jgi:hypothetical protein
MLSLLQILATIIISIGLLWWSNILVPGVNDAETPGDDEQPRTSDDIRDELERSGINLPDIGWQQIKAAVRDHLNCNYSEALNRYRLFENVPHAGVPTNLVEKSPSLKHNLRLAENKLPRKRRSANE